MDAEDPQYPFPGETDKKRFARELTEIINELRLVLPGVQMLFGFMLVAPFSDRFTKVTTAADRAVFFVAFACTAVACALLIAPSVYHRLHWRRQVADKERMLRYFTQVAIVGAGFVAIAMTSVIFVITDVLLGQLAAILSTIAAGIGFFGVWFIYPLRRRSGERAQPPIAQVAPATPPEAGPG